MATPRAAEHRDLEQRLRNVERALRQIASAALRRDTLAVTAGDFEVSGGGGVRVHDGGNVTVEETGRFEAEYADGTTGLTAGGFDGELDGILVQLLKEDGSTVVFQLFRQAGGLSSMTANLDNLTLTTDSGSLVGGNGLTDWTLTGGVAVTGGVTTDDVTIAPRGNSSNAANVRFSNTGRLLEVTSSRRFKTDIADAPDRSAELLDVQPRTWRDKAGEDTDTRHVGYIAEELAEAGLTEYVEYDAEGQPHAIQYDRLTVPLLQLAQRQQARLDDLTARLEALEAKG